MAVDVLLSDRAEQQVSSLRARDRKAYDAFVIQLRAQGCKALKYRMTGNDPLGRLCVAHLIGPMRVVVAFESEEIASIVLVGPHDNSDPFTDVYSRLYELIGLESPPESQRDKPPCCGSDDGLPPSVDAQTLEDLVKRARALSGAAKRRARRQI